MLSFRAFALLGWLVGSLSLTVVAEDSNWSHRYPPPVKVAPLVRPNVQQASHVDEVVVAKDEQRSKDNIPTIPDGYQYDDSMLSWRTPPHRTIEAPSIRKPSPRQPPQYSAESATEHHPGAISRTPNHGYTNEAVTAPVSARQGHSIHGHSIHGHSVHGPLLPTLPGVVNDPISAGPGRIGLGTHWIKNYPQHQPSIPGATVAPRWKTPYSYGHFGAEGKRHWTRQHGYRDRYLQWTLR